MLRKKPHFRKVRRLFRRRLLQQHHFAIHMRARKLNKSFKVAVKSIDDIQLSYVCITQLLNQHAELNSKETLA